MQTLSPTFLLLWIFEAFLLYYLFPVCCRCKLCTFSLLHESQLPIPRRNSVVKVLIHPSPSSMSRKSRVKMDMEHSPIEWMWHSDLSSCSWGPSKDFILIWLERYLLSFVRLFLYLLSHRPVVVCQPLQLWLFRILRLGSHPLLLP